MKKMLNERQINLGEENYISSFAAICMDLIDRDNSSFGEVLYYAIVDYFKYLDGLEEGSARYNYAKYFWTVEILETDIFGTQEDCYTTFEQFFEISKEDVPKCIREGIEAIDNEEKKAKIYNQNVMAQ